MTCLKLLNVKQLKQVLYNLVMISLSLLVYQLEKLFVQTQCVSAQFAKQIYKTNDSLVIIGFFYSVKNGIIG